MEYYNVRSLNTIRGAHAILNEEGLVIPEPGRGVRVVALPTGGEKPTSPKELISEIRRLLSLLESEIRD
jgi:DNA-binding GntR family transcriptional regulator